MRLLEVHATRRLRRGLCLAMLCLAGCRVAGQHTPSESRSVGETMSAMNSPEAVAASATPVHSQRDQSSAQSAHRTQHATLDRRFAPPAGSSPIVPTVALIGIETEGDSPDDMTRSAPIAGVSPFDGALDCPCEAIRWRDDLRNLCPMLCDDACSVATWKNAIIIGVATGGVLALRENVDGEVRAATADHPEQWGDASQVLRQFGEASWQVPVLFGLYGVSAWQQDPELHSFSKAVISAHALSSLATVALKGVTNTGRPTDQYQNGNYGFPSYHTSSTFAIAATIEEYYGWKAGVPAYALAGLVGWSRIDQREHDLSDVVFGAVLGYVIGKSVAATHLDRDCGGQVVPYYEPVSRTAGLMLDVPF